MDRKAWLEKRRGYIGSSDAAALLGLDPWRTAADVYLSKVNDLDDCEPTAAMQAGTRLEPIIIDYAEQELGVKFDRQVWKSKGVMASTIDGLHEREGCEAKTSSMRSMFGDAGTDDVAEHVMIQAEHHIHVHDLDVCHVPVMFGERGFPILMYRVDRHDALIATIRETCESFWRECVIPRIPPDDFHPSLDVVKLIRREPGKIAPLSAALVERWQDAKRAAKEAADAEESAKALILAHIGDADAGDSPLGRVTYYEQTRKAYEVKESTFRVLRFKATKQETVNV